MKNKAPSTESASYLQQKLKVNAIMSKFIKTS